jgi:hypothetical protein
MLTFCTLIYKDFIDESLSGSVNSMTHTYLYTIIAIGLVISTSILIFSNDSISTPERLEFVSLVQYD